METKTRRANHGGEERGPRRARAAVSPVDFVVVEAGGAWSGWSDRASRVGPTVRTIVQQPDEPPRAFTDRVRRAIARLERLGERIHRATLVPGGALRPDVVTSRFLLLLALSMHVRDGGGHLVIEAPVDDEARRSVACVAAEAARETEGCPIVLVDRLDTAGRASGGGFTSPERALGVSGAEPATETRAASPDLGRVA